MANKKVNNIDEQTMQIKVEMDQLVEKIKELDIAIAELNELFKMRTEILKEQYEEKKYELEQKRDRQQSYLRELFEQVPQTETKTQRKEKLLSGDVVVKKSKLDFEKDNDKLLEWAKANQREDLISRKETLTFKWADFKKDLLATPNGIVEVATGELLDIPGLEVIKTEEKLEIKY